MVYFRCFDNNSEDVRNVLVGPKDVWSVGDTVPHFTNAIIYVLSEIRKFWCDQKSTLCTTAILVTNGNMVIMCTFYMGQFGKNSNKEKRKLFFAPQIL